MRVYLPVSSVCKMNFCHIHTVSHKTIQVRAEIFVGTWTPLGVLCARTLIAVVLSTCCLAESPPITRVSRFSWCVVPRRHCVLMQLISATIRLITEIFVNRMGSGLGGIPS